MLSSRLIISGGSSFLISGVLPLAHGRPWASGNTPLITMPLLITLVAPAAELPLRFSSSRQCRLAHTGIVVIVTARSADLKLLAHALDEIMGRRYFSLRLELVLRLLDRISLLSSCCCCLHNCSHLLALEDCATVPRLEYRLSVCTATYQVGHSWSSSDRAFIWRGGPSQGRPGCNRRGEALSRLIRGTGRWPCVRPVGLVGRSNSLLVFF